jgi:hypothetical protein
VTGEPVVDAREFLRVVMAREQHFGEEWR